MRRIPVRSQPGRRVKFPSKPGASFAGILVTLLVAPGIAGARGVSPYLPLNMSPEIERQIEQVMLLAGRPVMTRPLPAAAVLDALPDACKLDALLCKSVRRYLDAYMDRFAVTHASVEIAATRDSSKTLANRRGMGAEDAWALSAQGLMQINDYVLLQAGGLGYPDTTTASGSWLSMGYEYAQLDIGYRDHWWSPMTDSGMLITTQAQTMPGVSLSNYKPISSLGIQYELYAAEMSYRDNFIYQGQPVSGRPRIGGMLVSIQPAPGWALSASRLLQYGGDGRPSSFSDFTKAFFDPVRYDNVGDPTSEEQFGNQVAALTSRFIFPGRRPFSVYFEYAGEDGSRSEGWRLGNVSLSAGLDIPKLWDRIDVTYEISDWQNSWYVSGVYADGTSNEGHVIGHWGADDRVLGDAVGAQSQSLRVGWTPPFGGQLDVRYRTLANEEYYGQNYEREHELALRYSRPYRDMVFGAELQAGRDVFGEDFGRVGAFVRFVPGQPAFESSSLALVDDDQVGGNRVQIFVDGGVNFTETRYDPSDKGATPQQKTSTSGPHLGIGARRMVSKSVDLGARVEFDTVDGNALIGVRPIDYRYRFGDKFAVNVFAGATRYAADTAAYGYYGGIGAQWRDLLPRTDLSLDLRATDKVARDVVLPDDPESVWGDVIYQFYSASLYLSYRLR